jgi:uroporphyrinogen-III synthase
MPSIMQKNNTISILCTASIEPALTEKAACMNIELDAVPFIQTVPSIPVEMKEEITRLAGMRVTVVFTSVHAVEAVSAQLAGSTPEWKVFCIAHATQQAAIKHFGADCIEGTADSSGELADTIMERIKTGSVFFFCGDQRRDELPTKLSGAGIEVAERVVYKTRASSEAISKKYDGVLFFSPSAVHSFFSLNSLPNDTILFVIGPTTANALSDYTANKIIVSRSPDKSMLVQMALGYFRPSSVSC